MTTQDTTASGLTEAQEALEHAIGRALRLSKSHPNIHCRDAAEALVEYLAGLDGLDDEDIEEGLDAVSYGVERDDPESSFGHKFGLHRHLVGTHTIGWGDEPVGAHLARIESGEADPADWWDPDWDTSAAA